MNSIRLRLAASVYFHAAMFLGISPLGCTSDDPSSPTMGSGGSGAVSAAAGMGGASAGTGGAVSRGGAAAQGGTSPGTAGTAGASGALGDLRDDPTFGEAVPCALPADALITDFTPPAGAGDAGAVVLDTTFGNFPVTLAGGAFTYPSSPGNPYNVNSDISTGEWHLSGDIGTYSGFGLYFQGCNRIDAASYLGISFTVHGTVALGDAVTLSVGTSSNDISYLWLNSQPSPPSPLAAPNSGRCLPATNQYDGTCSSPSFRVPVTATETLIEVHWADLTAGSPSNSVDPAEITSIAWNFTPPNGAGTANPTPYPVDLYIDDIGFISP